MGTGNTGLEFCIGERDGVHLRIQHRQVGMYSQGAGKGLVGRKPLRGNIRGKGGFCLN